MSRKYIYSKASDVTAEDGIVNVDGPDGVDIGLTPDAALETSERLLDGAVTAQGQRHFESIRGNAGTDHPSVDEAEQEDD